MLGSNCEVRISSNLSTVLAYYISLFCTTDLCLPNFCDLELKNFDDSVTVSDKNKNLNLKQNRILIHFLTFNIYVHKKAPLKKNTNQEQKLYQLFQFFMSVNGLIT